MIPVYQLFEGLSGYRHPWQHKAETALGVAHRPRLPCHQPALVTPGQEGES
jgi:hypothetical protein